MENILNKRLQAPRETRKAEARECVGNGNYTQIPQPDANRVVKSPAEHCIATRASLLGT